MCVCCMRANTMLIVGYIKRVFKFNFFMIFTSYAVT